MKHKKTGLLLVATLALVLTPVFGIKGSAQEDGNGTQRLIVSFEGGITDDKKTAVKAVGAERLRDLGLVNGMVVTVPSNETAQKLAKLKGVKRVEKDVRVHATAPPHCSPWPTCKNRPAETQPAPSQELPWGVDRIDAEKAWDTSRGANVKVAVIDTGIDKQHSDLIGNLAGGVNFVKNDTSKRPADRNAWNDDNGHGTHVAGTIAAADNTIGVIGVAPEAELYGVKVLDSNGSGYLSDVISGIEWSIINRMHVINLSLGTSSHVQSMEDAVDAAYAAGIVVVAAAGNSGDGNSATNEVNYPAKYDSAIAVAATDSNNQVAYFSSDGAEVEVAAPGVNVLSTIIGGGYGTFSGTSMASPHVAGVAAAVLATPVATSADTDGNGKWSADEVRAYLQSTANDLGTAGRDVFYGYGLADAEEAVTGVKVQ